AAAQALPRAGRRRSAGTSDGVPEHHADDGHDDHPARLPAQAVLGAGGDGVTTVRAGAVDPSVKRDGANGYYITPLVDVLNKHANRLKKIAAMGGTQFDGTAMVMVDKNTPYRLLTEVLYSAGQAEFKNYHLVVIRKSQ